MTNDQTFIVTVVLLGAMVGLPLIMSSAALYFYPKSRDQKPLPGYRLVQVSALAGLIPLLPLLAFNELINEQAVTAILGVLTGYVFSLRRSDGASAPSRARGGVRPALAAEPRG